MENIKFIKIGLFIDDLNFSDSMKYYELLEKLTDNELSVTSDCKYLMFDLKHFYKIRKSINESIQFKELHFINKEDYVISLPPEVIISSNNSMEFIKSFSDKYDDVFGKLYINMSRGFCGNYLCRYDRDAIRTLRGLGMLPLPDVWENYLKLVGFF